MPSPESGFWNWFRLALIEDDVAHQRIETTVGIGVPDVFLSAKGVGAWVELKALNGSKVVIRPAQKNWHDKFGAHGCPIFVVNRDPSVKTVQVWRWPYLLRWPDADNRDQSPRIVSPPDWQGSQKAFRTSYRAVLLCAAANDPLPCPATPSSPNAVSE